MSGYRLETFSPPTTARAAARSRSRSAGSRPCARRPTHDGFLAGQAMATEAYLDDETRLTSDLVEAIADARRHQRGGAAARRRRASRR